MASAVAAATAGTAAANARRLRRRRAGRRPRWRTARRSSTRFSNPGAGSRCGASAIISSATEESASSSRRQSAHPATCSSTSARCSPSAIPSASSGRASRVLAQSALGGLIFHLQLAAELAKPVADAGLHRPHRGAVELRDLLRGATEKGGQHERSALLFGQAEEQLAQLLALVDSRGVVDLRAAFLSCKLGREDV